MSNTLRSAAVGAVLGAVAIGFAACGGSNHALGPGSYAHPKKAHRSTTHPTRPTQPVPSPSTHPPTPNTPSYLHPPSGQPWTVPGSAPWVAAQFVKAMNSVSWQWSTPAQYLYDARSYMTPAYYDLLNSVEQRAIRDGGAPGDTTYWHNLHVRRDGQYAAIDFAYTITEAGVTPTSQVVRVAYWLGQIVGGVTEPVNTEHVAMIEDLSMQKVDGAWKVAGAQSPAAG